MNTKVFQGTIDHRLKYRIEEVMEDTFTLETKLPESEWLAHGAFTKLEYAIEHLFKVVNEVHGIHESTQIPTQQEVDL